jgi:hypothetical protein
MKTRRPHPPVQLNLLHARPSLPVWSRLPPRCRDEVVALLVELLQQAAQHRATAVGTGRAHE